MSESRSLELRLESKIDSVAAAELIVTGLAREAGFDEEKIGQLGLAVRESMVNAVAHGNGYSQEKTVHFSVEASSEALTVGIRDEGEGFDPDLARAKVRVCLDGGYGGVMLFRTDLDPEDSSSMLDVVHETIVQRVP